MSCVPEAVKLNLGAVLMFAGGVMLTWPEWLWYALNIVHWL